MWDVIFMLRSLRFAAIAAPLLMLVACTLGELPNGDGGGDAGGGSAGQGGAGGAGSGGAGASGHGGGGGSGGSTGTGGTGGGAPRTWGTPMTVASGASPRVAMGGTQAALVWLGDGGSSVVKALMYNDGPGWDAAPTSLQGVTSPPRASLPAVSMNASGIVLAIWAQVGNGEIDAALNDRVPASGWQASASLAVDFAAAFSGSGAWPPAVSMGGGTRGLWLTGSNTSIGALAFVDTGIDRNNGPFGPISDPGQTPACPAVAVNQRGAAISVWTDQPSSAFWTVWGWFYDPDVLQPPGPVSLGSGAKGQVGCPQVVLDDNDQGLVTWSVGTGSSNSSVKVWRYAASTGWAQAEQTVAFSSSAFNPTVAMSPTTGQGLLLAEQDPGGSGTSDLVAWRFQLDVGQLFDASGPASLGGAADPGTARVVVPGAGQGVVVWTQASRIFASSFALATGWASPVPIDRGGSGFVAQHPDLATDGAGRALAAWEYSQGGAPDIDAARFE